MFALLCLFIVCFMFYKAARKAGRNSLLWLVNGVIFWLLFSAFFLAMSERILLSINSFEDIIAFTGEKLMLEGISSLIIIMLAYLAQEKIGVKRKKTAI